MKKYLVEHGINYNNDYNALDTALRESKEETHLDLTHIKPKELYTSDDFGITNDERLHTKVTHYLFHLGTLEAPPTIKPGSDIESLQWIAVTDINLKNREVKNSLPIRESYILQTLPRALKKLRQLELSNASNHLFETYRSIGAYTFSDPFSKDACEYHNRLISKAKRISQSFKLQLAEFKDDMKIIMN